MAAIPRSKPVKPEMPAPTPAANAAVRQLAEALSAVIREAVFDAFTELEAGMQASAAPAPKYIDRPAAALMFNVCTATIAEWERSKGLPSVRIGDTVRYSADALDQWAANRSRVTR